MSLRSTANYGIMSRETLEAVVEKAWPTRDRSCGFTFQGGGAHFGGLDFFRELIAPGGEAQPRGADIQRHQTNGFGLDEPGPLWWKTIFSWAFPWTGTNTPTTPAGWAGRRGHLRGGDEDHRLV